MDEQDPQEHAGPRATDLIADFHARHEAWRRQGENLDRLRADARAAAAVEAAAILTTARGDIRRTIVDARRALLVLTAQLQAITQQPGGQADDESSDDITREDVPYSVLQARRDLARLLTDMRPELDELTAQTQQFAEPQVSAPVTAEPALVPEVEINDVEHDAALAAIAPLFAHELEADRGLEKVPAAAAAGPAPAAPKSGPRFSIRDTAILVAVLGVTGLAGAGWWIFDAYRSEDLARTVASIPPAGRVKPAWLDDRVPTINATLVGVPSSAPAAAEPKIEAAPAATHAPAAAPDASR
jgi:hypothetical protein